VSNAFIVQIPKRCLYRKSPKFASISDGRPLNRTPKIRYPGDFEIIATCQQQISPGSEKEPLALGQKKGFSP
jgi:hypothetical protein